MRIVDTSTQAEIATSGTEARTMWGRFRGLMLRRRLDDGAGLRIEPCSSVHMMFMLFSIDAVFYDDDLRVTKVSRRVRPWIGIAASRGAKGVIELPVGAAAGVEAGHQLAFSEAS